MKELKGVKELQREATAGDGVVKREATAGDGVVKRDYTEMATEGHRGAQIFPVPPSAVGETAAENMMAALASHQQSQLRQQHHARYSLTHSLAHSCTHSLTLRATTRRISLLLAGKGGGSSSATAKYAPPPPPPLSPVSLSLCLSVSLSHCPPVWIRPLCTLEDLTEALKADWDHCVAAVHLIM